MKSPAVRRWVEAAIAGVALLFTVLSLIWPRWIEDLLGASPDGGNGEAERWFALVWLAGAALFGWLAHRDHRRARAAYDASAGQAAGPG